MTNSEKILLLILYGGFILLFSGIADVLWVLKSESINSKPLSLTIIDFIPLILGVPLFFTPMIYQQRMNKLPNRKEVE